VEHLGDPRQRRAAACGRNVRLAVAPRPRLSVAPEATHGLAACKTRSRPVLQRSKLLLAATVASKHRAKHVGDTMEGLIKETNAGGN
jgi:hypothetical protein